MEDIELLWLKTISDDPKMIAYRPRLRPLAGSVTATILLQQIIYRWVHNEFEPFYKYKEPCLADDYREGDSWCEELGFSREEFDTALRHIGQKVRRNVRKDVSKLVWYWTMPDRKTWYEVNYHALCKVAIPLYVNGQSRFTKTMKPSLDNTKVTTKNTSKNDDDAWSFPLVKVDRAAFRSDRADQATPDAELTGLRNAADNMNTATLGSAFDGWERYRDRLSKEQLRLFCRWCIAAELKMANDKTDKGIGSYVAIVRAGVDKGDEPGLPPIAEESLAEYMQMEIEIIEKGVLAL